ncbi:ras family-domain-containing protein [Anaeramoeba ignava]|uniref:Ras family-domain-containing protein n=1 Tax=Anaeramoeba ignava TaxID=1746090 RepID=A0A9Q0RIK9_ANAIG|nr:ras family-domain-containing protein [Anaeramoeba ignava]
MGDRLLNEESLDSVKIVLIGDSGVGKTCIAKAFESVEFTEKEPTIGSEVHSKAIYCQNGKKVMVHLWDTSGQEKFHSLAPLYYRNAGVIIFVFDPHIPETFQNIKTWLNELDQLIIESPIIALASTKHDLDSDILVSEDEIRSTARKRNAEIYQTSAKNNDGIQEMFAAVTQEAYDKKKFERLNLYLNNEIRITSKDSHKLVGKKPTQGCC